VKQICCVWLLSSCWNSITKRDHWKIKRGRFWNSRTNICFLYLLSLFSGIRKWLRRICKINLVYHAACIILYITTILVKNMLFFRWQNVFWEAHTIIFWDEIECSLRNRYHLSSGMGQNLVWATGTIIFWNLTEYNLRDRDGYLNLLWCDRIYSEGQVPWFSGMWQNVAWETGTIIWLFDYSIFKWSSTIIFWHVTECSLRDRCHISSGLRQRVFR
jgi:hypothetical protein